MLPSKEVGHVWGIANLIEEKWLAGVAKACPFGLAAATVLAAWNYAALPRLTFAGRGADAILARFAATAAGTIGFVG